ncbi:MULTISPECIES: hypothetical protein [unclassified Nostoc]|nr:hypothetical protein [Nostoc sp. UHCC 0926]
MDIPSRRLGTRQCAENTPIVQIPQSSVYVLSLEADIQLSAG